jgi:outer membrane protein assembly factor BamB
MVFSIRPGSVAADKRVDWTYAKGTGYVLSNILYGDYVYLLTDTGVVTCLNAVTGAIKYEGGRPPVASRFMGSPVAFGGFIAMTSEEGQTFMLKAGPTHEIVRTNTVNEPVYSSLAIANGRIFIRAEKHLYAISASADH